MTNDLLAMNAGSNLAYYMPTPGSGGEQGSCFQTRFWAGLSNSLTELSITVGVEYEYGHQQTYPRADTFIRTDMLTQLKNLTSLKIQGYRCCVNRYYRIQHYSYGMDLPGLRNLHMADFAACDMKLNCPNLRSLTLEHCWFFRGRLSLQAPLEELSWTGLSNLEVHEAFPLSNLLGLTYCQCQFIGADDQERFYAILPQMSMLKTLDFVLYSDALPPRLPASLQNIRYLTLNWDSRNLERIEDTCQLPALQSISLLNSGRWLPNVLSSLKDVQQASKAKVILEDRRAYELFTRLK